jgi:sugar/nucleoside kinase (ribokinase family)
MSETYEAVVAGHICLDVIPDLTGSTQDVFETMFLPGRLLEIGPATFSTGGPVSNTGLALHTLGISTKLMGKVGDDVFGQTITRLVAAYDPHLAEGMIVDKTASSSYTIVVNPPGIDRILLHCPGANDTFTAGDVRYELLPQARLFHFGYPPLMKSIYADDGAQLADVFRRAKKTGITTTLDMALPDPSTAAGQVDWVVILGECLPYVDIFLPSIEEILYMLRRDTYNELFQAAGGPNFLPLLTPELLSDLSQELLALGVKIVALKLGDRGLYIRTANQSIIESLGRARPSDPAIWADKELWGPCFKVDMVGAAGSLSQRVIARFLPRSGCDGSCCRWRLQC